MIALTLLSTALIVIGRHRGLIYVLSRYLGGGTEEKHTITGLKAEI
jgi:hypothetical protein